MCHDDITIKEGAIFVADAHYNTSKGEIAFLDFLQKIATKQIQTPQLFLLGDIFDALFGYVDATKQSNKEVITLLEEIATEIEVIYLEGNHDFMLRYFFSSNIKIFPIQQQPLCIKHKTKTIYIAHGDFDAPLGYMFYTMFIRNKYVLQFLSLYNKLTNNSVLNFVHKHMAKKEQCKKITWFDSFVTKRSRFLPCDIYIDGHFHQNKSYHLKHLNYFNLGAFACNQRYFVVQFSKEELIFQEKSAL